MKFMICDRNEYHDIPTPSNNPYEDKDKYIAIMQNYGLTTDVWYPCELISTLPRPDITGWAYDIQLSNTLKYIRVLKSELDNGYVKLDFEEGDDHNGA